MIKNSICLSESELRSWSLGHFDDEVSEHIADHLSECELCEETVASFDDTADSLLSNVRDAAIQRVDEVGTSGVSADVQECLQHIPNPWLSHPGNGGETANREFLRDYELLKAIGTGGMGTVYQAVHTKLQRTVALKLLPARRLRDRSAVNRFEREMQAIGRLDHPSIHREGD